MWPRWPPARARPCRARSRPPGTRGRAAACTCCRSTTTWPAATPSGCGLSMTCWASRSTPDERRSAYSAQVTYAPVSEIGFDVLRDRLGTDVTDLVAPEPDVVLIDEADSVMIDEALVPLVLARSAGQGDADHDMAEVAAALRPRLHYETDDDGRNVQLTNVGARAAERALGGIDLYA